MLQRVRPLELDRPLWSSWTADDEVRAPADVRDEADDWRIVEPLAAALGAAGAVVTLHKTGAGTEALFKSGDAREDIALAAEAAASAGAFVARGGDRNDRAPGIRPSLDALNGNCDVLRLLFRAARGDACLTVSILFYTRKLRQATGTNEVLSRFLPGLDAYCRLWLRNASETRLAEGLRDSLHLIGAGVVLVDDRSRIIFANRAAEQILGDATILRRHGSSLAATSLPETMKLQAALAHAILDRTTGGGPTLIRFPGKGDRSLIVCVVPNPAREEAAATLLLLDPAHDQSGMLESVCRLYGLSPVECRLACLLTSGATLQEASERMRVKEQTARAYLKQIFAKMGTSRQADMVRLILSSLPPLKAHGATGVSARAATPLV